MKRFGGCVTSVAGAAVRGGVAGVLCVLLAGEPMLGQAGPRRGPTAGGTPQAGDARILHALNRLTFGPRPGEIAAVKSMGLSQWFEAQLNPVRIDDSAFEARLANYPAMKLPQAELIARYPSQQIIRQMAERNLPLPADPVEHAIYADQLAEYKIQQEKKQEQATAAATGGGGMEALGSGDAAMSGAGTGSGARLGKKAGGEMAAAAVQGDGLAPEDASRPLPRLAISDGSQAQAPAEHVEALFKDLEAVKILNLPPEERMRRVLGMSGREFAGFRESLSGAELAQFNEGLTPEQREVFGALQNSTRVVGGEVQQARMLRDVYSERQVEAVMTDFWLNHFNVYIRKNQNEPYLLPAYEREAIRPNALGKFEDLLVATAKSPAMLMYLDNWQSIGPESKAARQGAGYAARLENPQARAALKDRGLNENYGRELMELHTLGVNGGYTQKDVTEVAKVFTGWTMTQPQKGGEFQFDDRRHEPGAKTVLGQTIQENGMNEGLEVLHMLATSPATARFVCGKLAVRFVSDAPAPALVDRMAKTWMDSGGDIKMVLRTMFNSAEFWMPEVQRAKVKTPEEFVISAVRAAGAQVNNPSALVSALDKLGMPLYGMQTPNGYSWASEPWVSTGALVARMNFALVLAADRLGGTRTDWTRLLASAPMPHGAGAVDGRAVEDPEIALKEAKLERLLLGVPVSERTRAAVIAQSGDSTAAIQAQREFQGGAGRGPLPAAIGGEYNPALPGAAGVTPVGARAGGGGRGGIPDDRQAAIMAGLLLGSPEFQRR
ncbi:MAG: DUF1800 domain-containing protein [Acidobacteriota bacterium]|nr:DUF1800 domain-containing protein [Acidobacteriota bacterium]